jgi:hypothetical protein
VSDLAELYVLLVVIYVLECAAFVPRRALGLGRRFGRWGVRRVFAPGGGWRRGLVFGEPWLPLSPPLVSEPLPLVVGPDGVWAGATGTFFRWEDVEQVEAEAARLSINSETVAVLATRRSALSLAEAFDGLGALSRQEREKRLRRWLDSRFDDHAIEARLSAMGREIRGLRVAANVLWATVFLGLPVLLWTPLASLFIVVGAAAAAAWIAAAFSFEYALRHSRWLAPQLRPDVSKRVAVVASPLATMRACDLFARELVGDLDPLAVAAPLLRADELRALARARLVELKYRRPDGPAAGGEADLAWWRGETLKRIERTLRAHGIEPAALLAEPPRDGSDAIAWCPLCLAQYGDRGAGARQICANASCDEIALCAFDQAGPA